MQFTTQQLKLDLTNWILNWVSQYSDQLGHVPCPFAKNALLENKISWHSCDTTEQILSTVNTIMLDSNKKELEKYEVFVIGIDPAICTAQEFEDLTKELNDSLLIPTGYIALEDHPDSVEEVNGACMNQGSWALLLIQSIEKLNKAEKYLQKQGYYKNWDPAYFTEVVERRR